METLKIEELLKENGLDTGKLQNLANIIMKEYCIFNGAYHYRPIEIEFYIYDKDNHPDRHVYPRDNKSAGELFFHYSGMDICFKSSFEDGRFGGVLIRALERDEDKQLFCGPLICVNEVLNSAIKKCEVMKIAEQCEDVEEFGQRVGINMYENLTDGNNKCIEDTFYDKRYRFVRKDILNKTLEGEYVSYDFKKQTQTDPSKSKRKYKIEKYIPKTKSKRI